MSIRIFCRQFDVFRMLLVRKYLTIYVDCRLSSASKAVVWTAGTGSRRNRKRNQPHTDNQYPGKQWTPRKNERFLLLYDEFSNNSSNGSVQYLTVGPEIWIYMV